MDYIAHILWSGIIFAGPQIYLAILFGVLPDTIPFGLNMIISPFRNRQNSNNRFGQGSGRSANERVASMMDYYAQPQNQWVYKTYNYTHSILIWAAAFGITYLIGIIQGFFPYFMLAWLIHIVIDIPTHTKAFFAPQFLTPISTFCVDGKSWAHPKFMAINYLLIVVFIVFRVVQYRSGAI